MTKAMTPIERARELAEEASRTARHIREVVPMAESRRVIGTFRCDDVERVCRALIAAEGRVQELERLLGEVANGWIKGDDIVGPIQRARAALAKGK